MTDWPGFEVVMWTERIMAKICLARLESVTYNPVYILYPILTAKILADGISR